MSIRKLKILCLHGFGQNAAIFRKQTCALRKSLKDYAEFVYVNAPYSLNTKTLVESTNDTPDTERSWWFMNETTGSYDGKDKSLEYLSELVTKESYDGLIGFSQGAMIGSCMATLCSNAKNLKFAILISGRPARDPQLEKLFTGKCAMPSLHVIGEADTIVPKEDSMKLSEHFKDASLLFHSGGHYVPQGKEHRERLVSFIKSFAT
jgi:predicted esterase